MSSITWKKAFGSRSFETWWVSSWLKVRSSQSSPSKMKEAWVEPGMSMSTIGTGTVVE